MRRLRIAAWPAFSNAGSNPYQGRLYTEIAKEHDVTELFISRGAFRRCLRERYDIVHVHWIERVFWGQSRSVLKPVILAMLIFLVLKIKGARVVWTVHDPVPHDMADNAKLKAGAYRLLWLVYRFVLVCCIDGLIFLSTTHIPVVARHLPRLRDRQFVVTPHPHYRGVYPNVVSRADARALLGLPPEATVVSFVGALRPYKNADGLLKAFTQYRNTEARLLIAGKADPGYGEMLKKMADGDERVLLDCSFVPEDRLQDYLNAADVVVLPFHNASNSGSLLLALSFNRPVAVPNLPVFHEIRDLVGSEWVYLYEGKLGLDTLASIVSWARNDNRDASPPMDSLGWPAIAARTVTFYLSLMSRRTSG